MYLLERQTKACSFDVHLPGHSIQFHLSLGLYKIVFYFKPYLHESMIFFANTTFVWAPHFPPSSHTPLRSIVVPLYFNVYHTILLMTISCKCQSVTSFARSKAFALIWYRALTWYSSPPRSLAAPDDPRLVTGQQGSPSPACQQLSRSRNVCAGGSSERSTKLGQGTKLGPTLC